MPKILIFLLAGSLAGVAGSAGAAPQQPPIPRYVLDPVIVTATRTESEREKVGSTFEVVYGEQMRARGYTTVLEALSAVAGVAVARAGAPGGTGGLFLRGGQGAHLLVLIDGVPVNDPISPDGAYDWSSLTVEGIERIEIVKGPQSTLYGSDAMAGVVHIITRDPDGDPDASLLLEGGPGGALNGRADWETSLAGTILRFSGARHTVRGVSSAAAAYGNSEPDTWTRWSGNLTARRSFAGGRLRGTLRGARSRYDLDDFGGPFGDDPNHRSTARTLGGTLDWIGAVGGLDQHLSVGASILRRDTVDPPDPAHPDEAVSGAYFGLTQSAGWQAELRSGSHAFTGGVSLQRASGRSRYRSESGGFLYAEHVPWRARRSFGLYLQDQWAVGRGALTAGIRLDGWTGYGTHRTARIALSLPAGALRLHTSVGSGFKAPSLYQLDSPLYGRAGLSPERSLGADAGVEWTPGRGTARLGVTFHRQDVRELIDFVTDPVTFASNYLNRGRARMQGAEISFAFVLPARFLLEGSASWTGARDRGTGERLLRRPVRSAALSLERSGEGAPGWGIRSRHLGPREDLDFSSFPAERVTLPSSILLDAHVNWPLGSHLQFRLRVEDLLDAAPEWVWGYGTAGRVVYLGIAASR